MSTEIAQQAVTAVQQVPEIKVVLAQMITSIMSGAGTAVDFAVQQAPDVIKQLIVFNLVYLWALVLFGVGCLYSVIVYWRWARVDSQREHLCAVEMTYERNAGKVSRAFSDTDVYYVIGTLYTVIVGGMLGLTMFLGNIGEALKITLAPKVWLIEYAVQLMK